jgi:hypothetical protein
MRIKSKIRKPVLTVVVNFFNNRREADRTLFSLSSAYQNVSEKLYRVIAVDNNSTEPLDNNFVKSFGSNFSYIFYKNEFPSPCKSINFAVKKAKTPFVVICIDGARILSPGILNYMIKGVKLAENPFIYTIGMHIGHKPQNYLIEEGYNQDVEDKLLETTNWKKNGYELFKISSKALSSPNGYFSPINESNCFLMRKEDFFSLGGYDEQFVSNGGGLVNLDFFNKVSEGDKFQHIMLLGEATFHQFHGGVATNVLMSEHPWEEMVKEYKRICHKEFIGIKKVQEFYGCLLFEYHSKLGICYTD